LILVDANVLLHAYHPRSQQHDRCRSWLERAFSSPMPVGLPWLSIWAFLRIGTNPRAFERPMTTTEARTIVTAWLALETVRTVEPGERYWQILSDLLVAGQVSGPLVTDAAIAALALENGASLCTTDRDFARFPALRTIDPTGS
jgi:toxin-antitoxin system PIN domain toxin